MAFNGTIQEITLNMYGDAKDDKYDEVQQGDSASRVIRFKLKGFKNEDYAVPYGAGVALCIKKSDGKYVLCTGTAETENTVLVTLTSQACACAGKQPAQLYIYTQDGDIKSQSFYIKIPEATYKDDAIKSENEVGVLIEAEKYLRQILETKQRLDLAASEEELRELKDQVTNIVAASSGTEGNAELQDIRYGADGKTYPTAGEAMRGQLERKADKDDAMSWSDWFDLHRTGWHGGVTFPQFSTSQSTLGTKTGDNANMVAETSTNTTKGRNDYAGKPVTDLMFNGIEVNGYIDEDGEPHITAVKGSPNFSRTGESGDVWMAFLTPYYKRISTDTEEGWDFADHKVDDLVPWPDSVRPDGSVRSFYLKSKYPGVTGKDGLVGSISGCKLLRNTSHNNQIAEFAKKGSQYCGMTTTDMAWAQWMDDMKFANHNSQTFMAGATGYYNQYPATVTEDDVKRIIISKNNAKNLVVGSYASIGYGFIQNGTVNTDRGNDNVHKYADDVKILKIEDYDDNNSAVYVDAPTAFSTAAVALSDTLTSPVYLSTMHWWSGACDDVLGPDGSPSNCTSGKEPFILSGVEFGHGGFTVLADIIMSGVYDADTDTYTQTPYIVHDSRKIANNKITDDYAKCSMTAPDTNDSWQYISKEGYDPQAPWLQIPIEAKGSSSTGFADGVHTGARNTSLREFLWFGHLGNWSRAGLRCAGLHNGVDGAGWGILRRLSYLRRGVAARG